ncbi:bifunctional [glutamine synthetase] adenylyltransferase/[glutamine synthetase]-adenylyl-L-tyrosine phosphorylase [Afifella pfennigii]|uniref:bifunctional [glutamine synthetase] adenylyltransferase/[glutamine synthetase]-adenylyl-L-tyrosine phosphorylase n=1 Tax=Afifella pfennigii TaxID=209897 RepID=UPI00068975C1|nr:bifunctional [glutamine synthetase] adenylyltransferase/[glutamine synthetase]-adenylyl-L-tyrosine phosphorylase [Afifella pfennigii]
MSQTPLRERLTPLPRSPEGEKALEQLAHAARRQGKETELEALLAEEAVKDFLAAALGDCPYLLDLAAKDIDRLAAILAEAPEATVAKAIAALKALEDPDEKSLMGDLRRAKQKVALTLGLADLAGAIDLEGVVRPLSDFADAALDATLSHLLCEARRQGKWQGGGPEVCGLTILAMGKHGARELNYSSDIDLIVLFDPERPGLAEGVEAQPFWVRVVRRIVHILQERTADGYVFRVDLRLRPDPGATPVAISVPGALSYYESMGQNWERAALIKARPAAGEKACGRAFLDELAPYIWRKYLDFAAIADIHSIKRQVHAHRGHAKVRAAGHDLKRGRGGIRDIELFAQTQQLIGGGRDADLRCLRTRDTLKELAEKNWIEASEAATLDAAYVFLRQIEHRLQMVRDEQTHTMPQEAEGVARIARLAGYDSPGAFEAELLKHLHAVAESYQALFEEAPSLSDELGNLVFTGGEDDPETLKTLSGLGYKQPENVTEAIRAWHFGRYQATRSTKARERLTEFTPALLAALAETSDPDHAFRAFDSLVRKLPAGVPLFSLLAANPTLLELIALILGASPLLADTVAERPHVIDLLTEPDLLAEPLSREGLAEQLAASFRDAKGYEDKLDRARAFAREMRFLIAVKVLAGAMDAASTGGAYADLAEVVIKGLFAAVLEEFARRHGKVPGGEVALLALGRLGSREMTATSDLDLIVVYDYPEESGESDGERPLAPSQYYTRLTQRFVTALSAPTAEGAAYEVDLRLRPSGRAGPLATRLSAFSRYQREEAWTWEHMALCRARPILGDAALANEVAAVVKEVLSRRREDGKLKADIVSMYERLQAEKGGTDPWQLKTVRGGLIDLEFLAQYLVLCGAVAPEPAPPARIFAAAKAAGMAGEWDSLIGSARLQAALLQGIRLIGLEAARAPAETAEGTRRLLLKLAGAALGEEGERTFSSFPALVERLTKTQEETHRLFAAMLEAAGPAPGKEEAAGAAGAAAGPFNGK